jgi:hypothetical protein
VHRYRSLEFAEGAAWGAMAMVAGESVGPACEVDQCLDCSAIRLTFPGAHDDEPTMYGVKGELKLSEPECIPVPPLGAVPSDPCQAPSCSSKRSLVGPLRASYSLDAPEMTPELRKATPKRICTNCHGQLSDAKRAWYVWKD